MPRAKKKNNFEQSLQQLETLVEALETGELTLEQSLKHFEEGIALTRSCHSALTQAEQTIKTLSEKNGDTLLQDLDLETIDD